MWQLPLSLFVFKEIPKTNKTPSLESDAHSSVTGAFVFAPEPAPTRQWEFFLPGDLVSCIACTPHPSSTPAFCALSTWLHPSQTFAQQVWGECLWRQAGPCAESSEGGTELWVDEPRFWDQKGPWPPVPRAFVSLGLLFLRPLRKKEPISHRAESKEAWSLETQVKPKALPWLCAPFCPRGGVNLHRETASTQLLLPWAPRFLSLSIYFLVYNFFPYIKGIFL